MEAALVRMRLVAITEAIAANCRVESDISTRAANQAARSTCLFKSALHSLFRIRVCAVQRVPVQQLIIEGDDFTG